MNAGIGIKEEQEHAEGGHITVAWIYISKNGPRTLGTKMLIRCLSLLQALRKVMGAFE